jgi:hypothetical protein
VNATTTPTCQHCGRSIKGRVDKKFCDDACRNAFNNQLKSGAHTALIRNINTILAKNRRVLEALLPATEDMAKTTKEKLLQKGFQFNYLTHTYTNKKGNVYYFCYDMGYLPLDNDWFLIVKRKEEKEKNLDAGGGSERLGS